MNRSNFEYLRLFAKGDIERVDIAELIALGGFVYFATPYTDYNGGGAGGRDMAFRAASQLAGELEARGLKLYAPIAHGHPVVEKIGFDALRHADWMASCFPFMVRASCLLVATMPGFYDSRGIRTEFEFFWKSNKPVFLLHVESREIIRIGVNAWVTPGHDGTDDADCCAGGAR